MVQLVGYLLTASRAIGTEGKRFGSEFTELAVFSNGIYARLNRGESESVALALYPLAGIDPCNAPTRDYIPCNDVFLYNAREFRSDRLR